MSLGDSEADRVLVLIQAAPRSALRRNPPLLLSHDGSGTIFNYYLLDPLERDVFGFQDPRAACGNGWEGGIHQMARLYYDCMKTAVKPGPVLLGGEFGPTAMPLQAFMSQFLTFSSDRVVIRRSAEPGDLQPDNRRSNDRLRGRRHRSHRYGLSDELRHSSSSLRYEAGNTPTSPRHARLAEAGGVVNASS